MTELGTAVAIGLLLAFGIGLLRVLRGPSAVDRLLGLLLTGSTGIALLMVLHGTRVQPGYLDVALVLALLTPVTVGVVLSAARLWHKQGERSGDGG